MTPSTFPAKPAADPQWRAQELLLMSEVMRLVGKSLAPGVVMREMLHLMSELLGLNRGRIVLANFVGDIALQGLADRKPEDRPDTLQAELDALTRRVMQLAETPFEPSAEFFIDVLDARAHGAELCLRAAQSALMHQGARGYLMSSEVQRRVRESHFVAIVTPAIKHLRKEIARLSAEEQPA